MMRLATGPDEQAFVLLDDARVHGAAPARLFRDPGEVLTAASPDEIPALFDKLEAARRRGLHAAGYLAYEAGKGLAPAWRGAAPVQRGNDCGAGAPWQTAPAGRHQQPLGA